MTFIQKFLTVVLPKAWAEDTRAESLTWMMLCTCGFERFIWERWGSVVRATNIAHRLSKIRGAVGGSGDPAHRRSQAQVHWGQLAAQYPAAPDACCLGEPLISHNDTNST
jgi:hypothetical protein